VTIGEILKENRESRGYSLSGLAELMETSEKVVNDWEKNVSIPNLQEGLLLSRLYGKELNDMFCDLNLEEILTGDNVKKFEHEKWLNRMKNRTYRF